ncbi:ABC transporter substrate-binding protein [Corynebacterium phocae]|uniref:ABC transporter substrate-binding protein n=1 Tax=Corynebacterium phocae TaxID=161895 RepID=A0A1L7D2B6_9CORY|nr:ABC transporter substrate-binding protein [Corynebacterium phocae]APT92248.1 ABC transporter substrate-binding protein [Corynebacterium phocae]KAA8725389.1 ABC transporter substrate-binding protein [Corynebacterium phocae]
MSKKVSLFRKIGALSAAAGIAATLAACAPADKAEDSASGSSASSDDNAATAGEVNEDGTIRAAISYELGTNGYDPMTTTAALTIAANWHTLEGLTELDPTDGSTYAALAAELPEPSEDTEITVELRDGAKFSDGTDITAEDVVYSFERVMDPANNSLYASFIEFIESVEADGDNAVKFKLKYPTGVFAERLSVVKIVPKALVEKDPEAFDFNPVGSGPFKMTDNGGATNTVKFERNEHYNGPRPARAADMAWDIIPDASTRINSLQSDQVQAIDSVPYLNIAQLEQAEDLKSQQGFGLLFAMFNNDESNQFSQKEARQAFLYAIDMDTLIQNAMQGQASPATSFLHENHPNYNKASTVYSYDEAKAKELFEKAGVTKLRLLVTDHDWVKAITPLIEQDLKKLGLEVEFTQKKSSDVYNTIDGNPDSYDVVIAPGDPSVFGNDPDLLMRWWYGNDTWTKTRMNWSGESYDKVQDLLSKGIQSTDKSEQQEIWNETYDVLSEEVPLYPLLHRKAPTAWDSETLVDFEPISLTGLYFLEVGTTQE